MVKVRQTKSGNVRITLSQDDAGKLWGILLTSHIPKHPWHEGEALRVRLTKCESVSRELCTGFALAGLRYGEISPEGKASREDIPS